MEWLKTVGTLLVGAAIPLVAEWLRHRRIYREEATKQLVTARFQAVRELQGVLNNLAWTFPIVSLGVEVIRWPKFPRLSPAELCKDNPDDALNADMRYLAREFHEHFASAQEIVNRNSLLLGRAVVIAFYDAFGELQSYVPHARTTCAHDVELADPVQKSIDNLRYSTLDAIGNELDIPQSKMATDDEVRARLNEGQARAKKTLAFHRAS